MSRRMSRRSMKKRLVTLITMSNSGLEERVRYWPSMLLHRKLWQSGLLVIGICMASIAAVGMLLAYDRGEMWLLFVCVTSIGVLTLICLPIPAHKVWVLVKEKRRQRVLAR